MSDACCHPDEPAAEAPEKLWEIRELRWAALAAVLLVGSFLAERGGADRLADALALLSAGAGGWTFVPSALRNLRRRIVGVGTLMMVAGVGAVLLGEFEEAAMLAVLFSIAEGLEEYSLSRACHGLRALLSLLPETAVVHRGGVDVEVEAVELRVGDGFVVRPGERVPTDGVVLSGRSAVDTAAITGESLPVEVQPGDEVFAGSVNGLGALEVRATATVTDNSLARVVHIVEEAQAEKGQQRRLADRIARPLVYGVIVGAALVAGIGSVFGDPELWVTRALVVLVAASPCALAISVPITVVAAIGAASRFGVIIKGGAALESLGTVRAVALDKTGTLTRNQPVVVEVATTDHSRDEVLALAAAVEARSEHPLAAAILAASPSPNPADDVTAVTGAGLRGTVGGVAVRLGRPGWVDPGPLADAVIRLQNDGSTTVLVEADGEIVGAVAVRDEMRPEARGVVAELQSSGLTVLMLTGDNSGTARALARHVGIADVRADLSPEDKGDIIRQLERCRPTAMVGDGVNDAPALALSSVGIAMGAMGTDVAIETADVALMGHDLRALPAALNHARRARQIMIQNVGLSLAIVAGLLPTALLGLLGLAAVVAVHEIAEVLVILNGLRAARTSGRFADHGLHPPRQLRSAGPVAQERVA
jgi:cation-transporting ATPase G